MNDAMGTMLKSLWRDECGFVVSAELVLAGTLGVLGLVTGLSEVSGNVNEELKDVARGVRLNQSYSCRLPSGETWSFQDSDAR